MNNPTYWAVIPANVRYSKLKANAKLLYGEISALTNKEGYCWASNNYFAELYGVSKNTISLWINQLKKYGFIHVDVIRDKNKQVIKRTMSIIKNDERSQVFKEDAIIKNNEVNNTSHNNINNNSIQMINFRKMKFGSEVSEESVGILSVEQSNEFLDYWTETNRSETKMRFEMERTWNTRKRLFRWKKVGERYKTKSFNSKSKITNAHNEWMKAKEFIEKNK